MRRILISLVMPLFVMLVSAQEQPAVTITEFVKLNEGFSTLAKALETTGLGEQLQEQGPFTFFAPTDEAFAAMPQGRRNALLNNPNAMRALLMRHLLNDRVLLGELTSRGRAKTEEGSDLTFSSRNDGTVVVDDATVIGADIGISSGILVSNGVIHIVDRVLQK